MIADSNHGVNQRIFPSDCVAFPHGRAKIALHYFT